MKETKSIISKKNRLQGRRRRNVFVRTFFTRLCNMQQKKLKKIHMTVYHPLLCISLSLVEWIHSVWGHHFLHTLNILNKKGLMIPMESLLAHILRSTGTSLLFLLIKFRISTRFNANKSIIYNIYHPFFVCVCVRMQKSMRKFWILSHRAENRKKIKADDDDDVQGVLTDFLDIYWH